MANEYSYNELMQMQDKAIERVRMMQERARKTMEENPIEPLHMENRQEEQKEAEEVKAEPVSAQPPKAQNQSHGGGILSGLNLNMDKDKAMVLPLLLLLMNEGADSLLLLALMYIMA